MPRVPYPLSGAVPSGHMLYANDHQPVVKFGKNEDVDAADGEVLIWDVGTTYPYQTSAQSLEVLSTSATDTVSSTGAHTIQVSGLDENWDMTSEVVSMNGVTPVDLENTYIRVYRMALLTAGSDGANVGDITLRVDGGGSTLASMPAGDGATFLSLMPIPRGYVGYVYRMNVSTTFAPNSEVIIRVRYRPFGGAFRVVDERSINRDAPAYEETLVPLALAPKSDIALTAQSIGNNGAVYAGFTLVLVPT